MKKIFYLGALLLSVFVQSCKTEEEVTADVTQQAVFETLMPMQFISKFNSEKTAVMVDVRTMAEFNDGHRMGALNINVNSIDFDERAKQLLDTKKPVFVYCLSGVRSMNAANRLKDLGFRVIYNLNGGYHDIKNL